MDSDFHYANFKYQYLIRGSILLVESFSMFVRNFVKSIKVLDSENSI